jgi:NTE family protein
MIGKSKVALVIGWGSVKCAASLGLMRVLQREGIEIDLLVGSGGGSIYAAILALGYDAEEIIAINQRLWTREVTSTPNRQAILQMLFPRSIKVRAGVFQYFGRQPGERAAVSSLWRKDISGNKTSAVYHDHRI